MSGLTDDDFRLEAQLDRARARVAELERERDEARTLRDELHLESIRNADFSALLIRERDAAIKERDEARAELNEMKRQ